MENSPRSSTSSSTRRNVKNAPITSVEHASFVIKAIRSTSHSQRSFQRSALRDDQIIESLDAFNQIVIDKGKELSIVQELDRRIAGHRPPNQITVTTNVTTVSNINRDDNSIVDITTNASTSIGKLKFIPSNLMASKSVQSKRDSNTTSSNNRHKSQSNGSKPNRRSDSIESSEDSSEESFSKQIVEPDSSDMIYESSLLSESEDYEREQKDGRANSRTRSSQSTPSLNKPVKGSKLRQGVKADRVMATTSPEILLSSPLAGSPSKRGGAMEGSPYDEQLEADSLSGDDGADAGFGEEGNYYVGGAGDGSDGLSDMGSDDEEEMRELMKGFVAPKVSPRGGKDSKAGQSKSAHDTNYTKETLKSVPLKDTRVSRSAGSAAPATVGSRRGYEEDYDLESDEDDGDSDGDPMDASRRILKSEGHKVPSTVSVSSTHRYSGRSSAMEGTIASQGSHFTSSTAVSPSSSGIQRLVPEPSNLSSATQLSTSSSLKSHIIMKPGQRIKVVPRGRKDRKSSSNSNNSFA